MKAIRARIRGLGDTIETGWFELSPRLNLFHFPEERGRSSFLKTLATLNPLLPCERINPFADFPLVSKRQGYLKRISPEKRTVALAIFNATPDLVGSLAAVSPHLYETDRIEVGRRLDCSRWINFVEIASSARWCEIAESLAQLVELTRTIVPEKAAHMASLIQSLQGSDRIKNGIARELGEWLESLPTVIGEGAKQRLETLVQAIHRAENFRIARRIVERHLPIFVVLTASSSPPVPLAPLLDRINGSIRELGGLPAAAARDFVTELNEHLAAIPFAGPRLRLATPGAGVELSATPPLAATADPESSLRRLQAATSLAIALSRVVCRTEPFLLFDSPERHLPGTLHRQLGEFILTAAEFCQCCYGYATVNIFSRHKGIPKYPVSDLTAPRH